jgi:glycerol-3-phosphate acyltransferase PlsY
MMVFFLVLIGYVIGSIPSGYLAMRYFTGTDIRTYGTGSATVTAVAMHGGRRPATAAFLLEIGKAIACFYIAAHLVGEDWATMVILVAAVFGCSWSVWLRGNGGQGLTIGMSGLILRNVLPILIMSLFYLLPLAITKKHVASNRIFRASLPPILAVWYGSWEWFLAGLLIIAPSIIKGWVFGDDVEEVKKAQDVGHSGAGAV